MLRSTQTDILLERKIMDELKSLGLVDHRTIILTTHRLSTVMFCHDYYLLKKKAGISENGSVHEKIKNKENLIYEHFQDQFAIFKMQLF